jgi:large subunit ribosomal protein L6
VAIPGGVTVAIADGEITVTGPKGELTHPVLPGTTVTIDGAEAKVTAEKIVRNPMFGTMRAKLANMVTGVTTGFTKVLEIVGTGYRAQMDGKILVLQLGYSHPIRFTPPEGITIKAETPVRVSIHGADKYMVGQVAADIRGFRPPEPYKGKGVKYEGEYIRRKAGKAAGSTS